MIWCVIWVVLMCLWLFGSGFGIYNGPAPNHAVFIAGTIIPWLCVLILGLALFGGIEAGKPFH